MVQRYPTERRQGPLFLFQTGTHQIPSAKILRKLYVSDIMSILVPFHWEIKSSVGLLKFLNALHFYAENG